METSYEFRVEIRNSLRGIPRRNPGGILLFPKPQEVRKHREHF